MRQSEASLAAVQRIAQLGSWEIELIDPTNLNRCPTRWSDELFRIFGYEPGQFTPSSTRALELIVPHERPRVARALSDLVHERIHYHLVYRIILATGRQRIVEERSEFVGGTKVSRLIGTVQDITERSRTEQAHRESEERFMKIFQASPVAIACSEIGQGGFIDVNARWLEFFGYERAEIIGWTDVDRGLWVDLTEREKLRQRLEVESRVSNYECRFRRKSGELRVALLSIENLRFGDEPVQLMMLTDITERIESERATKRLETQLLRAQRLESVGRLASGIAHDMNNILAPFMMVAPLLRTNMTPEEKEKLLTTIETSAMRGSHLVRQLLYFGRGGEGQRGPLRLKDAIHEIEDLLTQTFPRNIIVEVDVAPETSQVHADATQLHQVLLNLCLNARDAMPEGGTLRIAAANAPKESGNGMAPGLSAGAYVRITIADTGMGIPADCLEEIWDPFFTTKELGKGTGLGLFTVLGIVKAHGGCIEVESYIGRGTEFRIYIPAFLVSRAPVAPVPEPIPPRGQGEVILLVDDEVAIRELTQTVLRHHGYQVIVAANGDEGISQFVQHADKIRLVVTDLDMPVMSGLLFIKSIRQIAPDIKAIVSSGSRNGLDPENGLAELHALGIEEILVKPYTPEGILNSVHKLIGAQ